jgi:superfamily II RNA helicase
MGVMEWLRGQSKNTGPIGKKEEMKQDYHLESMERRLAAAQKGPMNHIAIPVDEFERLVESYKERQEDQRYIDDIWKALEGHDRPLLSSWGLAIYVEKLSAKLKAAQQVVYKMDTTYPDEGTNWNMQDQAVVDEVRKLHGQNP